MMKVTKILLVSTVLYPFSGVAYAQQPRFPRFQDYPISEKVTGKPTPVNLRSHPKASLFRTKLREGAKRGPNFAGHYTLLMWGCGADCMVVAVVDAKTGRVYFAPFTVSVSMKGDFRINSRLFIRNPPERNERPYGEEMLDEYKPSWHVWKNGRFIEVYPRRTREG